MATTRHYGVSRQTGSSEARELAELIAWHQVPERGQANSTDRMLDTVQAIINGTASGYDFNKARDWIRRFPLRSTVAKINPEWPEWEATLLEEIAESVLMHGWTEHRTAVFWGTTPETVSAIVAAHKMRLKRGSR